MNKILSLPHLLCLCLFIFVLSFSDLGAQEKVEVINNENSKAQESTSNFYISQFKKQNAFDGFGYYKLYNNAFNYENDRGLITLGAGLLEQNTIFNNQAPAFSASFNSYFEYRFTNRFSSYLSGQYLTPSFNREINLQDVFMHPLFPQTEIGAGLKGNFNNVEIDVGTRSIFNAQPNLQGPSTLFNTKVSIGL